MYSPCIPPQATPVIEESRQLRAALKARQEHLTQLQEGSAKEQRCVLAWGGGGGGQTSKTSLYLVFGVWGSKTFPGISFALLEEYLNSFSSHWLCEEVT